MLVKFSLFNSVLVFVLACVGYFYNGFELLWEYDVSRFTFIMLGLYAILTIYIGFMLEKTKVSSVLFFNKFFPALGLIGTVIGSMVLLYNVGNSNPSDVTHALKSLFTGYAAVLLTTACGIGLWVLMNIHVWFLGLLKGSTKNG